MKLRINPVLQREIRVKMRGWKSPITIVVYLSILILFAGLVMFSMNRDIYSPILNSSRFMSIYSNLSIIQFVLIMFIAPALTAGSITGEREKQTLDLLLSTKMSTFSIVTGKLMASISHILLLIIASLPIFSIVFLFGGISALEILQLFGFYLVTAIAFGAIGIFFSTFFKRTAVSNVGAYGTIGVLCLGTLVIYIMTISLRAIPYQSTQFKIPFILYTNPLAGFNSLMQQQFGTIGSYGYGGFSFLDMIMNYSMRFGSVATKGMEIWKGNIIFNICLIIILLVLSGIKLNPVKKNMFKLLKGLVLRIKLRGKQKDKSQDVI